MPEDTSRLGEIPQRDRDFVMPNRRANEDTAGSPGEQSTQADPSVAEETNQAGKHLRAQREADATPPVLPNRAEQPRFSSAEASSRSKIVDKTEADVAAYRRMWQLAAEQQPELLDEMNRPYQSLDYLISYPIAHAKNESLRRQFMQIKVENDIQHGRHFEAVATLVYADVAEISESHEYGEEFIVRQYDQAVQSGAHRDAWLIAQTMVHERDKIIATDQLTPEQHEQLGAEWEQREQEAFRRHAEHVLEESQQAHAMTDDSDLAFVFDEMKVREVDGFREGGASELPQRVGQRMVERSLANGRGSLALAYAVEAELPDDYIRQIEQQVRPSVRSRMSARFRRIGQRMSRLFG